MFNVPETIRSRFVQVTRPAQVTGALGTGYVSVAGPEGVPFPLTKGTADLDPNRDSFDARRQEVARHAVKYTGAVQTDGPRFRILGKIVSQFTLQLQNDAIIPYQSREYTACAI